MAPESRLRARCAMLLKSHLAPPGWYTAIEHGRMHRGTPQQRAAEWARLAAQGVRQGLGDLLVMTPGFALWLELKAGANKQSPHQHDMQAAMARLGHGYAVVRSVEGLVDVLEEQGIALHPGARVAALRHDGMLAVAPKPRRRGLSVRALSRAADAEMEAGG